MGAKGRGWLLFWLATALLLPAVVLGLSKHERPVWESAQTLFAPGGATLMIYGLLVWRRQAEWIGLGADRPRRAGCILLTIGAALLGVGLAYASGAHAWRLLTIPAIIGLGLFALQEGWRGKRGVLYRINAPMPGWRLARAGLLLFGLLWPLMVLWALDLQSFE